MVLFAGATFKAIQNCLAVPVSIQIQDGNAHVAIMLKDKLLCVQIVFLDSGNELLSN